MTFAEIPGGTLVFVDAGARAIGLGWLWSKGIPSLLP